ncbi:MAG: 7TM diverse intracellular signaling domain-containing protein [Ramlibacter sp.]
MNAQELAVWAMALGAIAAVALARLADLIARPSISQFQGVAYHSAVFLLVLILSGVWRQVAPGTDPGAVQVAQVLAGPVCVGLSDLWIRSWLNAAQRDRVMSAALRASAVLLPLAGLSCLGLSQAQRLPAAAAVSLFGGVLTLWLSARAWRLGDPLAPVMTVGCLLTLPAIAGLYAIAMELPGLGLSSHVAVAACAALCNGFTGFVLWRRVRHERRTRTEHDTPLQFDPVTQLHTGASLVHKLLRAQRRRRHTRHDGAVLAIVVFDVERIVEQAGAAGVNEMFVCMASRIQRQVGVVNLVGRYYDRCFVSLVETIQSPAWLRTIGLRVATSLRRPMELTSPSGHRVDVRADIGVGVVHLLPGPAAVEDVLDDAQRMAEAARAMRSRAAIRDPATGRAVPVEQADLGGRWHGRAHRMSRVH